LGLAFDLQIQVVNAFFSQYPIKQHITIISAYTKCLNPNVLGAEVVPLGVVTWTIPNADGGIFALTSVCVWTRHRSA